MGAGADIHVRDELSRWTPLHYAAWQGKREACRLLIEHGARAWIGDKDGHTPARWAEIGGHRKLSEQLARIAQRQLRANPKVEQ